MNDTIWQKLSDDGLKGEEFRFQHQVVGIDLPMFLLIATSPSEACLNQHGIHPGKKSTAVMQNGECGQLSDSGVECLLELKRCN